MLKIKTMPSGITIIRWPLVCREIENENGDIIVTDSKGKEYIVVKYLGTSGNCWSVGILA